MDYGLQTATGELAISFSQCESFSLNLIWPLLTSQCESERVCDIHTHACSPGTEDKNVAGFQDSTILWLQSVIVSHRISLVQSHWPCKSNTTALSRISVSCIPRVRHVRGRGAE